VSDENQSGDLLGDRLGDKPGASGSTDNQSDAGSGGQKDAASGTDGSRDLPNWQKQLKPEHQNHKALEKFNGSKSPINDLAGSYIENDGRLGKSILIPDENATDEERSRFLSRMRGVATKDDYKFSVPKLPDGVTLPQDDSFKEVAFTAGLNNHQADIVNQLQQVKLAEAILRTQQVVHQRSKDADDALHKDWPGDAYEENMQVSTRVIEHFDTADELKHLKETKIFNDPVSWRIFQRIGSQMGETLLPKGDAEGDAGKASSGEMSFPLAEKIAKRING